MQAVILAAGRGRRMEPFSSSCHKALLDVGNSTILGRALDSLLAAGVSPITVVTGYRSDDVAAFVSAKYPGAPIHFIHNDRFEDTNNIVSLALALDHVSSDDHLILIECDLLFAPHLVTDLLDDPHDNVAMVDQYRTGMDGTVVSLEGSYITGVFPTSSQGPYFSYHDKFKTLNIYKFHRDFCHKVLRPVLSAYANNVDANCYYELVLGMLANVPAHRISGHVVGSTDWVEVDDPNDLVVARFFFDPGSRSSALDRSFGGHWSLDILDFSLPRNAYFPPPALNAGLRHGLVDVITGYGSSQEVLDEKVALLLGCTPGHVRLLNGASQAYPILSQRYRDARVLIPSPTFGEYSRCFPQARRYLDAPGIDLDDLAGCAAEADLVVVVNPNNPSGTTISTTWLYDLAASTPSTTFLIDESFLAFSGESSILDLLERAPLDNVMVLTSLGKALGVPGLRLGYVYSRNPEILRSFSELMPIWGVNALAEFFLELVIKFRKDLEESIALTIGQRSWMMGALNELEQVRTVHDSGANFLLVEFEGKDGTVTSKLRRDLLAQFRIEVKDVSDRYHDHCPRLRLAVRTMEDNNRLMQALRSLTMVDGQ